MTNANVIVMDRAWAAVQGSSGSRRSAILAMFGITRGSRELTSMQSFVAGNTKSYTVRDFGYQIGKLRDGLDVVGVNISASISAILTSVVIPFVNRLAPFSKIAPSAGALAKNGFATLPSSRLLARHAFTTARTRTEPSAFVSTVERLTAEKALSWPRWIAMGPTSLRAVMSAFRSICLHFEMRSTDRAGLGNLGVFHTSIISHNTQFTSSYVAIVQRWVDMTGGTPELIE